MQKTLRVSWMAVALSAAAACGGSDSSSGSESEGGEAEVFPTRIYTGYDGTNTYRAPIVVNDAASKVEWSIDDASLATLQTSGSNGELVTLISKKAGSGTVSAKVGSKTFKVPVQITGYTLEQWQAGKRRYEAGPDANNPACNSCHANSPGKPNHTPSEIDRDPDADLLQIITTGVDPEINSEEPAKISDRTEFADLLRGREHKWSITAEERVGLMAYMRSLEPRGRPSLDDD